MSTAGERRKSLPLEIRPGVIVCPDAESVAQVAAMRFVQLCQQFVEREKQFCVALGGGPTIVPLYRLLASDALRDQIAWAKLRVFWTDELAVPPDHPESNYASAQSELLSRAPISALNVHRMEAERADQAAAAAQAYEQLLRRYLRPDSRGFPRLHLIFLGMGPDGRTAGLSAGAEALLNTTRWVGVAPGDAAGSSRVTLTLPLINAAHQVVFLVTGADQAATVRQVLEGSGTHLPVQRVQPSEGQKLFVLDAAAAKEVLAGVGQ